MKIKTISCIAAIITIILLSCEKIEIGKPFTCVVGENYRVNSKLSFSIDSIRDYTCPKNMLCFWSGDVDLYFNIQYKSSYVDTLIYYMTRNRNPFDLYDYTWQILDIDPLGNYIDNPVEQKDYKIKMILNKN